MLGKNDSLNAGSVGAVGGKRLRMEGSDLSLEMSTVKDSKSMFDYVYLYPFCVLEFGWYSRGKIWKIDI